MNVDALPIEGPVFELAPYGHATWDLEITLDEWVAHELEDDVAALVAELPRGAGVRAVAHEDRERILVESGGLPRADLQLWLEKWWAATLAAYEPPEGG